MRFVCFDTEDNSAELLKAGKSGFKKQITQIAALDDTGDAYYSKGDVKGFKSWLLKKTRQTKERCLKVYAHNVQYDLGALFADELDTPDVTLVGGRMIKAVWGKIQFLDSFNLWPMSVKKLAPAFGFKKLEMDVHSREYVFRDVEIIVAAVAFVWDFCEQVGLPSPPPTLGGLCVKFWRFLGGENCHDTDELSRDALFGGRVELFKVESEGKKVLWTDINSLYPFVMKDKVFPGQLSDCGNKLADYGIARCRVRVPESAITVLPYRSETGRILYPVGTFTGTWTVAELQEAERQGTKILKVERCNGTNEGMKPYGEFVERLYNARLASNSDAEKLFFKLLMNNLYGRLGTSGVIGRTVYRDEKTELEGVPFGEKVLVNYSMPLSEETNWSHAAHVTAYGRLELFKYAQQIQSDLIYCDTDSVIFDSISGEIPFKTGKELGLMKVVQRCSKCGCEWHPETACKAGKALDYWDACNTYAPKLYQTDGVYKAKGVPKRLAQTFIETGKAEFDLPFKYREAVRFYDRKNSRKLSVWRTVTKEMRSGYDRKKLVGNNYFPCKVVE